MKIISNKEYNELAEAYHKYQHLALDERLSRIIIESKDEYAKKLVAEIESLKADLREARMIAQLLYHGKE